MLAARNKTTPLAMPEAILRPIASAHLATPDATHLSTVAPPKVFPDTRARTLENV